VLPPGLNGVKEKRKRKKSKRKKRKKRKKKQEIEERKLNVETATVAVCEIFRD